MKNVLQKVLLSALLGCTAEPESAPPAEFLTLPDLPPSPAVEKLPRGEIRPPRELAIALVGEVRGEIEPCGCPTLPYGGFERRQLLLERKRQEGTVFHLDAGELLLKGLLTARSESRQERARLLLNLSTEVGVDLWVPGPTDALALGISTLAAIAKGTHAIDARIPATASANLQTLEGESLLPASRILERDGLRLGVIGLTDVPSGSGLGEAMQAIDPVEAARAALAALPADLDLVVALGSVHDEAADRVATEVEGISLVLTIRGSALDAPRSPTRADGSPGALVVETPVRGRYVQLVRLRLGSTADQPVVEIPSKQLWRDLLTARKQAERSQSKTQADRLSSLESSLALIGEGRNLAAIFTIPLGDNLDGKTSASAHLDRFKDQARASAKTRSEQKKATGRPGYASSARCVNCHTNEFARWSFSSHARAWEVLLRAEEQENPECVACHSTGYGEPGGLGELTPVNIRRLKAVQCESCHGPMRGHPDDPRVKPLPITEARCMVCHDEANSPNFNFETDVVRATCQGGAPEQITPEQITPEKPVQEPPPTE
jgi:hypothetical protein